MSYKLKKTYTEKERADFVVEYNHNQGLNIEETAEVLYALQPHEMMQNGIPVENPEYETLERLKTIDNDIAVIETEYDTFLDSQVTYVNGKSYRIRYAEESYQPLISAETSLLVIKSGLSAEDAGLISSTFPLLIWDSTKLEENATEMSFAELTNLALYLTRLQQGAWDARKTAIAALEKERNLLLNPESEVKEGADEQEECSS